MSETTSYVKSGPSGKRKGLKWNNARMSNDHGVQIKAVFERNNK